MITREIQSLQALAECKHVVQMLDVYRWIHSDNCMAFDLVLEFCKYDLGKVIASKNVKFTLPDIKTIMRQLLIGLRSIHSKNVSNLFKLRSLHLKITQSSRSI